MAFLMVDDRKQIMYHVDWVSRRVFIMLCNSASIRVVHLSNMSFSVNVFMPIWFMSVLQSVRVAHVSSATILMTKVMLLIIFSFKCRSNIDDLLPHGHGITMCSKLPAFIKRRMRIKFVARFGKCNAVLKVCAVCFDFVQLSWNIQMSWLILHKNFPDGGWQSSLLCICSSKIEFKLRRQQQQNYFSLRNITFWQQPEPRKSLRGGIEVIEVTFWGHRHTWSYIEDRCQEWGSSRIE